MYVCVVHGALFVALTGNCYCLMSRANGKVVDPYSGMVVGDATSGRNGWRRC